MKRIICLFYLLFLLIYPFQVLADTHNVASCEYNAVATAIGASANGDTVTVPAGNCTWTTTKTREVGYW